MSMLGTSAGGEQLSTGGWRIYSGFQGLQIARHPSTHLAMEPVGLLSEAGQMLVFL